MSNSAIIYDREFDQKFEDAYNRFAERREVVTGLTIGNLSVRNNAITATNVNGNVELIPDGDGQVVLYGNPTSSLGAATKQYVDSMATNHTHVSSSITDFNAATDSRITLQKGQNNGLATLDPAGKVPASQLSISGLAYQGTWNATTNGPTLTSSMGTSGHYYVVSVAGSTNLNGIDSWQLGDKVIFNGSIWEKSTQSEMVSSVAGKQGIVVLDTADIAAGTFSDARIAQSNVIQHQSAININALLNSPTSQVVGISDHQPLTNKLIDASLNIVTNISSANLSSGINTAKFANGSVSNTQFQYLANVTSDVQTQLDSKSNIGHTHSASDITSGTFANARIAQSNVTQHQSAINIQALIGAPVSQVVGISDPQMLTAKTINAMANNITNIGNNQLATGINVTKLANGSVANAQFQHLANVNSDIQGQLNLKAGHTHTHGVDEITGFTTKVPKINFEAIEAPSAVNDSTQGYSVGSRWMDIVNSEEYVCLSSTVGQAIWENTTGGSGGGSGTIIVKDENINVPGTPSSTLNFVGNGVAVTNQGNGVSRVTIFSSSNKLDAIVAPQPTDDLNAGWAPGSKWFDVSHSKLYVCFDNSENNSVWNEVQLNLPSEQQTIVATVNTSDNTSTNLLSIATSNNIAYFVESSIVARRTDSGGSSAAYSLKSLYRNDDGVLTKVSDDVLEIEDDITWGIESTVDNTNILITCRGDIGKNISWKIVSKITQV